MLFSDKAYSSASSETLLPFDVSRKFLHCDIWLFLYKFQNIVVLFFCKNCFPASQLRSGLITASACTLFYKAVYSAFIY